MYCIKIFSCNAKNIDIFNQDQLLPDSTRYANLPRTFGLLLGSFQFQQFDPHHCPKYDTTALDSIRAVINGSSMYDYGHLG